MRQTLRDSHLTENGGPSVYRFLAVARRPPRPELVIYLGERPGPADAVLVWGSGRQLFDWQTPPWRHRVRPAATRSSQHRAPPPVPVRTATVVSAWMPIKTAGGAAIRG